MKHEDTPNNLPEGMNRENPFRVPDGYFERFPIKIAERIAEENQSKVIRFAPLLKPAPMLAIAATLITIAVVSYKIVHKPTDTFEQDEISNYVYQEGIIDELSDEEILDYSDFADADSTFHKSDSETTHIQNYLLDEDVDINDIINEM
jgi:hypothetical protein